MIRYTTQDIIKRALELADLQNSDFISYREKLSCLNESYTQLYQKLVNSGDGFYVRAIDTNENIIPLPSDMHQIKSVCLDSNGFITPITRRPTNQNLDTSLSYDIMNNAIRVNGMGGRMGGRLRIEYYPTPKTLYLSCEDKYLSKRNVVDMKFPYYLTTVAVTDEDNYYALRSCEDDDTDITINVETSSAYPILWTDDYIVFRDTVNDCYITFSMATGNITGSITYLPTEVNGKLLFLNNDKLYSPSNVFIMDINCECNHDKDDTLTVMFNDDLNAFIRIGTDNEIYNTEDNVVETSVHYFERLIKAGNYVYAFGHTNYLVCYDFSFETVKEWVKDKVYITLADEDNDNGYGFLCEKLSKQCISPLYGDTVLDFPNNMYFTLLSYMLAINFCIKQNKDVDKLSQLAGNAWDTFYDTLPRDDWSSVRITNMY